MTDHTAPEPRSRASTLTERAPAAARSSPGHDGVRTQSRSPTDDLPRGPAQDDDQARADRIVAVYTGVAALWIVLSSSITAVIAAATPWSPSTVEILKGLLFVGATALLLRIALRRWARRLTSAAELEEQATNDMMAVARLRAAFLASISHELRTPLTNIVGYAETIQKHHRELPEADLDRFAERLAANSGRLERLVLDMLQLHRPNHGDEPTPEPVHLDHLLDEVVAATCSPEHDVRVWCAVSWVELDRDKTVRLLEELVHNVCRHTPPGTTAWITATTRDGWLDLTIEDDGPGIDPGLRGTVTEPFVQGSHVEGLPSPGLGIGLALVAHHAELLGGGVAVSEPDGGGTRVTVALPHAPVRSEANALQ